MTRARSKAGYTLVELAIVVLIMGSMAAMIAPGLSEQLADSRAAGAAEGLVRLHRVVRARVNQTGLAHLMLFQATDDANGSNGLGRIRVWEGMNNRCHQTPWIQTMSGTQADGHWVVESLDMGNSEFNVPGSTSPARHDDVGRQVVRMTASTNATLAILCFEPGGLTYRATVAGDSPAVGYTFTPQTTAEVFSITRSVRYTSGGTPEVKGVIRTVVFPASGNARMRF